MKPEEITAKFIDMYKKLDIGNILQIPLTHVAANYNVSVKDLKKALDEVEKTLYCKVVKSKSDYKIKVGVYCLIVSESIHFHDDTCKHCHHWRSNCGPPPEEDNDE